MENGGREDASQASKPGHMIMLANHRANFCRPSNHNSGPQVLLPGAIPSRQNVTILVAILLLPGRE